MKVSPSRLRNRSVIEKLNQVHWAVMGAHILFVIPFVVRPTPKPRIYEKPTLLPGISLCGIGSDLGYAVTQAVRFDTNDLHDLIVVDKPEYTRGLIDRLLREGVNKGDVDKLSDPTPGRLETILLRPPSRNRGHRK